MAYKHLVNTISRKRLASLYQLWRTHQNDSVGGFTLTEVLATIIIGGIVISSLLAVMIELLQTDQQEATLTQTQQEMQMALDYIADDLRESVYIYSNTTGLPDFGANVTPVLAFWKVEPIDEDELPVDIEEEDSLEDVEAKCNSKFSDVDKQAECRALVVRRHFYSLIVYLQSSELDWKWNGRSRLLRYRLPKYTRSNLATLEISEKFVDPIQGNSFPSWLTSNGSDIDDSRDDSSDVLVDFVDDPASNADTNLLNCPVDYSRTPSNAATSTSFFACVRDTNNVLGENQDVILYLRGNAEGKGRLNHNGVLPALQSRVTLRGVIDKFN